MVPHLPVCAGSHCSSLTPHRVEPANQLQANNHRYEPECQRGARYSAIIAYLSQHCSP
jgi:hypothetical protein